jgi:hypothetical protein
MVPSTLKRHLHAKRSHLYEKPIEYFRSLVGDQTRQAKQWIKITSISGKAQEASYATAEIVARKIKSRMIAESVILSACCKIVSIMFGEEFEKEILKISMSVNTISGRMQDVPQDGESHAIANFKEAHLFAIQLDESTDITRKAQLVACSRIVCSGDIIEQFLFCKPLPETTKCQGILDVLDSCFSSHDLSRKSCISNCTDDASSMSGRLRRFVALAKQENPGVVFTHCFLHREALVSKSKKYWMIRSKWLTTSVEVVLSIVFCHGSCSHTTPSAHRSEVAISRAGALKVQ